MKLERLVYDDGVWWRVITTSKLPWGPDCRSPITALWRWLRICTQLRWWWPKNWFRLEIKYQRNWYNKRPVWCVLVWNAPGWILSGPYCYSKFDAVLQWVLCCLGKRAFN